MGRILLFNDTPCCSSRHPSMMPSCRTRLQRCAAYPPPPCLYSHANTWPSASPLLHTSVYVTRIIQASTTRCVSYPTPMQASVVCGTPRTAASRPRHPLLLHILCVREVLVANLLLYPLNVGRVHHVPGRHVLLHALRQARLLAARQGAARLRHAALEALLVDVLYRLCKKVSRYDVD